MTKEYLIEIFKLIETATKLHGTFESEIPFVDTVPGYIYNDSVVRLVVSEDSRYMEVVRQCTGELVVDVSDGILKRVSPNLPYIEDHIKKLTII